MLFWFNHDLRLDDNPALAAAAELGNELLCVYCDDQNKLGPDGFGTPRLGTLRANFIDTSLSQLARDLAQCGQQLLRLSGDPVASIDDLIARFNVEAVVRSRHFGVYENRQWQLLIERHTAVDFVEIDSYTLFDIGQVMPPSDFPPTFSRFRRPVEALSIPLPVEQPTLPPAPQALESSRPVMRDAGAGRLFAGGEAAARAHLERYFSSAAPSRYKQTRNELDGWFNSGKFSPWLAAGCLSVRRLYQRIKQYEDANGANDSTYWLYFELLWREFFQWYARTHAERLFAFSGLNQQPPDSGFNSGRFQTWCSGQTPWPLVNACMQQLNQTGYLSNRGRQIVASSLVYDLGLDWRAGAGYFENRLIDYDVASNWGNWQYIAGVGADTRGGRHFNIAKQTRQYDPDGSYIDRWTRDHDREAESLASPAA